MEEELDEMTKKVLVTIFYIKKMEEGDLISKNENFKITESGFNFVCELIESGFKLSREDLFLILQGKEFGIDIGELDILIAIILDIQEKGISEVLREFEEMKKKES